MWGRIALLLGGALLGGTVIHLLSDENRAAEKALDDRLSDYSAEVDKQRKNLETEMKRARATAEFHYLVNEHFKSVKIANGAYSVADSKRDEIKSYYRAITELKLVRETLKKRLDTASRQERSNIFEEMAQCKALIDNFYLKAAKSKEEREMLITKVRELNAQTAQLKYQIRDLSSRGRSWYNALEERSRERKRKRMTGAA